MYEFWRSNVQERPWHSKGVSLKVFMCVDVFEWVLRVSFNQNWCMMFLRHRYYVYGFIFQVRPHLGPTRDPRQGPNTALAMSTNETKRRPVVQATTRWQSTLTGPARMLLNRANSKPNTLHQRAVDGQTVRWLEPSVRTAQKLSHFAALAWGFL